VVVIRELGRQVRHGIRRGAPFQQKSHPLLEERSLADLSRPAERVDPRDIRRETMEEWILPDEGQAPQPPEMRVSLLEGIETLPVEVVDGEARIHVWRILIDYI